MQIFHSAGDGLGLKEFRNVDIDSRLKIRLKGTHHGKGIVDDSLSLPGFVKASERLELRD
jgi:hypothetical protein